jgi:hypothetical protein
VCGSPLGKQADQGASTVCASGETRPLRSEQSLILGLYYPNRDSLLRAAWSCDGFGVTGNGSRAVEPHTPLNGACQRYVPELTFPCASRGGCASWRI